MLSELTITLMRLGLLVLLWFFVFAIVGVLRGVLYGTRVGRLTSGGWSAGFGKSIGMGYVRPDLAEPGTKLKVRMFREFYDAVVTEDSPFDPSNARIRVDG